MKAAIVKRAGSASGLIGPTVPNRARMYITEVIARTQYSTSIDKV
jgi:hypothetical protein